MSCSQTDVMQLTLYHHVCQIKFLKFKMTISFLMGTGAGGNRGPNIPGTNMKQMLFLICC